MSRRETERYKQDRLGNSRREIDENRAREGDFISHGAADGVTVVYEKPEHATEVIPVFLQAFNDGTAANSDTVRVYEVTLNDDGTIATQDQRTVGLSVPSPGTGTHELHLEPFDGSIAIEADYAGETQVGVISDHHEEAEPGSESRKTPGN